MPAILSRPAREAWRRPAWSRIRRVVGLAALACPACTCRSQPQDKPTSSACPSEAMSTATKPSASSSRVSTDAPQNRDSTGFRPISPSTGVVITAANVWLRWDPPTDAVVLLSRHADFSQPDYRIDGRGGETLQRNLPQGRWFWRIMGKNGGKASPIWAFRVLPRHGDTAARQGVLTGSDVNGDGFDDILLPEGVVLGRRKFAGSSLQALPVAFGKSVPKELQRLPDELSHEWGTPFCVGDVDGDGLPNTTVLVVRRAYEPDHRKPQRLWLESSRELSAPWRTTARAPDQVRPLGDVNRDGYADLLECPVSPTSPPCQVWGGSADERRLTLLGELPRYSEYATGGDIDNDGFMDVVGITKAGAIAIHRGCESGLPAAPDRVISVGVGARLEDIRLIDIDGDAAADIFGIGCIEDYKHFCWWMVSGMSASTSNTPTSTITKSPLPESYEVGGMDWGIALRSGRSGGAQIVAAAGAFVAGFAWLRVSDVGKVTLTDHVPTPVTDAEGQKPRFVGDTNGDGFDDLLIATWLDISLDFALYLGNGRPFGPAMPRWGLEANRSAVSGFLEEPW